MKKKIGGKTYLRAKFLLNLESKQVHREREQFDRPLVAGNVAPVLDENEIGIKFF